MNGPFAMARQVADTVLYEGYVLYPYRASSAKNQTRWQFGVLMPPAYVAINDSERSACQSELVCEPKPDAVLSVQVRFLHVAHRTGGELPEWDETVERELEFDVHVSEVLGAPHEHHFAYAGGVTLADGVRRVTEPVSGAVVVELTPLPGPIGAKRLRVRVENRTPDLGRTPPGSRDGAMASALVAAHTMFALDRGCFVSMTDPPEWARPEVSACENIGTWPVLVDAADDAVVLSSPIILGDHPEIAPESPGDLYDATEIDEILTLRTMVLTDEEKAEARATDPRAAALIDRVDELPPEHLDRLHGALRYLRQVTGAPVEPAEPQTFMTPLTPWWDPGADSSVSPETDAIVIDGVRVARGSRVRLRPGLRRTDAQDVFLRGRTATVEAVLFDVDGAQHLGVTPDDDPELAEVTRWHGRYLYFAPDEVEPVATTTKQVSS
ncbi:MAG: hypothetical protein ACT4P1_09930 [Sporichthyaceae bacterium]